MTDNNVEGDDATSTLGTNMEGDDATSISGGNMDVSSLIVETKLTGLDGTDPIGQVLAGIEKTNGVLLYTQLKKRKFGSPLPTDTVMYGMFISYESDQCIIVLKVGVKTLIYKSKQSLHIVDAFNRILALLCH